MDLHDLLTSRGDELLQRWLTAARAACRTPASTVELVDRMPRFLDELAAALAAPGAHPVEDSDHAQEHGVQRLRLGFDIAEVVREYGLLHEVILEMAHDRGVHLDDRESRMLAATLNNGICTAVNEYHTERDAELQRQAAEHLGFIAHELRNALASAMMAHTIVRRRGAQPRALDTLGRALARMSGMIDTTLSHAWLKVGAPPRNEHVEVQALLDAIVEDVAPEAADKDIRIEVRAEPFALNADPRLLSSAVSNLVRNAVKFSRAGTIVSVRATRDAERARIEIEDRCGGLPPGKAEELFSPFVQKGADRSGFGLGLTIARQAAESHNGTLTVRNLPGSGCVFTLDLPAI